MTHRRSTGVIFSTFATLNHPTGRSSRIRSLDRPARAVLLALGVITAIAFLTGYSVARIPVSVALAAEDIMKQIYHLSNNYRTKYNFSQGKNQTKVESIYGLQTSL